MRRYYKDILDAIPAHPQWWDENAVPRYCAFHPSECADIYADEVALCRIRCQACECEFLVALSTNFIETPLHALIDNNGLYYGDPPNDNCCAAGPTMSSDMVGVVEFWTRDRASRAWRRESSYERDLTS